MNLEVLRKKYLDNGFTLANASAKICQDIILNKISKSKVNRNVTIKGGVVMYGLSNDKRRATRDLDLNLIDDDIKIYIEGDIQELHHQDYKGKRVNVILKDKNNFSISAKLDIGVHKRFDIKQEEYCFNLEAINKKVMLFINSKEQIVGEKIKSLLKFGIRTTRYKDIFDIYYLINNTSINKNDLLNIINMLIIRDSEMKEDNINDIIRDLDITLNNNVFKQNLSNARNNWLDISVEEVIDNIIDYFKSIEKVVS